MKNDDPIALIQDQDSLHSQALKSALESSGFQAIISPRRQTAIEGHPHPGIALVNLDLAGLDIGGLTSGAPFGQTLELIFMGSRSEISRRKNGRSSSATYFFCKPLKRESVPAVISDFYAEGAAVYSGTHSSLAFELDHFGQPHGGPPPLNGRSRDIVGLARHFLDHLNRDNGTTVRISASALYRIELHSWPGDVPELHRTIEHAYSLASKEISLQHLPALNGTQNGPELSILVGQTLEESERKLIFATLDTPDANNGAALESLNKCLERLSNRMHYYESRDPAAHSPGTILCL